MLREGLSMDLTVEELSLSAWPALQTEIYDGWLLRFAEGYTKRANSVNPLYPSALAIGRKIDTCEKAYMAQCLPTVFKLLGSEEQRTLDDALAVRGYARIDESAVRVLDIASFRPGPEGIKLSSAFDEPWIECFCACSGKGKSLGTIRKILGNVLCEKIVAAKLEGGRIVGCGYGAVDRGWVGVFDIVVDSAFRRRGFGEELVRSILGRAKELGAERSYLQVVSGNVPAENLYSKLGYRELYRYWYRMKPCSIA
jgi:ribosomal protein S18 acetylase RimI-like enzyme